MTQIQHIQQNITMVSRALKTWSDSLCGSDALIGDVILGFSAYNNEPKHGGTEV
jgi:hypothetical protein